MKIRYSLLLLLVHFMISSCLIQGQQQTSCNPSSTDTMNDSGRKNEFTAFYTNIPQAGLPCTYNYNFETEKVTPQFCKLPSSLYSSFKNVYFHSDAEPMISRLPEIEDIHPVLIRNFHENGEIMIQLVTLDKDFHEIDALCVNSIIEIDGGGIILMESFEITTDYLIRISQMLNSNKWNELVEQRYYKIQPNGLICEIAYKGDATITFHIENITEFHVKSFKWKSSPSGDMIKADVKNTIYGLDQD